ncbi:protein NDNF-like [Heterodontus francisci]|uniref:protein NDNF-like n=1 Tax=Heterodontus francisci TaxID=7792 RepID=UPI00355C9378
MVEQLKSVVHERPELEERRDLKGSKSLWNMMSTTCRNLLYVLLVSLACPAQKLPGRDLDLVQALYNQLTPQDLTAIPNGAEITGFLKKDTPKRYYFIVEEDSSPVAVRVTPCDTPLQWTLTLQELQDQSSGDGSGELEPLNLQKDPKETTCGQNAELFHYQGNDVESYDIVDSPAGIYRLELISIEKDTIFNIYATTTPESDQPYPKLPSDSRLDVTFVGHTSVSLVWKPSPAISQFHQPAQYCVVINKKHNYKSLCAIEAKLKESDLFKKVRQSELDWRMSKSPRLDDMVNHPPIGSRSTKLSVGHLADIQKTCTGTKNMFTVSRLKPNTQYYFDVFVLNLLTNVSSAYIGTFVKTKAKLKQKVMELKGGRVTEIFIKRGGSKTLRFKPVSSHRLVTVSLQSCYQLVHVQIRQNRKLVTSQNVEGVEHFQFIGKPKARYLLRLVASKGRRALLKVHITTHPNKQPFPALPSDTRLKVFDRLRTCSSLTVAWLATQEMNKYCIYRKLVAGKEKPKELQNYCLDPTTRSKSEKVSCQYFRGSTPQKAVKTERIESLEPGKTYQLDVYVIGPGENSVKYQSKIVRTRKTC